MINQNVTETAAQIKARLEMQAKAKEIEYLIKANSDIWTKWDALVAKI
jgi:hypothetical protein